MAREHYPANPYGNVADLAVFMLAHRASLDNKPDTLLSLRHCVEVRSTDNTTAACYSTLLPMLHAHQLTLAQLQDCSMMTLVVDWYCLRQAGDQSRRFIGPDRLLLYRFLADTFGSGEVADESSTHGFFSLFLVAMQQYLIAADH